MPATCLVCGRTYINAYDYDEHACIELRDIAYATLYHECHEEVSRRGELQPCDIQSVGLRVDPQENAPYPVCKRHSRAPMVPLPAIAEAIMTQDAEPTESSPERHAEDVDDYSMCVCGLPMDGHPESTES